MLVSDMFKQFCKERHEEDKKRSKSKHYNYMQEIYANAELFDISNMKPTTLGTMMVRTKVENSKGVVEFEELKEVALPFQNMFIRTKDSCLFIREYEPYLITGSFYIKQGNHDYNIPFTLNLELGKMILEIETLVYSICMKSRTSLVEWDSRRQELFRRMIGNMAVDVCNIMLTLNSLPKYSVVTDTKQRVEYYARKHASTIKVENRPIYYILDKEVKEISQIKTIRATGKLEFNHSFHVRGHWRKLLNPKTIGKDRNGEYKVTTGYTWVKDTIKGQGEFVKRIRVVK